MLGEDGRVRVLDFGLAATSESALEDDTEDAVIESSGARRSNIRITPDGVLTGTPAYMSPEQHLGEPTDAKSDQFSFCIALFEALYSARPFPGRAVGEIRRSVLARRMREPPAETRVPTWVRRAIERGLSVDPADRFESMDELLEVLDPAPRSARVRLVLGGAIALMAISAALLYRRALIQSFERQVEEASERTPCTGAAARVEEVWGDARRGQLREAILATGLSFAGGVWERVEARLDEFAARWATMHTRACEATHVDGTQSTELLDLRVACLEGRLKEFSALVEVFAHADATVVENAVQAAAGLPSVDRCAEARGLLERVAPPEDPAKAEAVELVRGRLADAAARGRAGQLLESLARAEGALAQAKALDYRPLLAESLLLVGDTAEGLGEYARSADAWREAYWHSLAIGDDNRAARCASVLVHVMVMQGQPVEARVWSRHASAVIDRLERAQADAGTDHRAGLANHRATAWVHEGKLEEAIAAYREALAGFVETRGADDLMVAGVHNNLGNTLSRARSFEPAIEHFESARRIYERELGPGHPSVAVALNNLGEAYAHQLEYAQAEQRYRSALKILVETVGERHINVGVVHNNLGDIMLKRDEPAPALQEFRLALLIFEDKLGADSEQAAFPLTGIGESLLKQGDVAGALASLERAKRLRGDSAGPFERAHTDFALAQALWRSSESATIRARAGRLADAAIEGFAAAGAHGEPLGAEARAWRAERREQLGRRP